MRLVWHVVRASLAFLCAASQVRALDWKADTQTVTTKPFQTELTVIFEFTNRSTSPVHIKEIETSCSCVHADSDLKIYPPGSAGKITANFAVGDRGGLYERGITVVTDEPGSPVRLLLRVEVPEVATVTPRSLSWLLSEPAKEKSVELTSAPDVEIEFSHAQSTSDNFSVSLEQVERGRHYRLNLKPRSMDHPDNAAVRIYGKDKSGHEVVLSAYVSVH